MKHRLIGVDNSSVLNADGHAIGVDVGASCVRAAVLAPGTVEGRPSVNVHRLGRVELPAGAVVNGVVVDPGALTNALKRLWQENKFDCRNVILGVANQQVLVRDLVMPDLGPQQRAKALPFQAREVVALPVDQVVLDFSPLGPPDPETGMVRGLLIAAPREPVLTAVRAVERAGLQVARVDLSSFAALRSIGDEHLTVEAVIDIGAHLATIVIHDHGVPRLVRTLTHGGQEITDQLADRLSVTVPEAEQAKRETGLDGGREEVERIVRDSLRPLIGEINTSLGYFRASNAATPIAKIALTGGGAALRGIAPALAEHLALPTSVIDPLQHVRNRLNSKATREGTDPATTASAVAIGLAMGAAA